MAVEILIDLAFYLVFGIGMSLTVYSSTALVFGFKLEPGENLWLQLGLGLSILGVLLLV